MADLVTEGQSWKGLPRLLPLRVHMPPQRSYLAVGSRGFSVLLPLRVHLPPQWSQAAVITYFGVFPTQIGPDSSQSSPYQILMTSRDQDMFGKLPKLKLGVNHQRGDPS